MSNLGAAREALTNALSKAVTRSKSLTKGDIVFMVDNDRIDAALSLWYEMTDAHSWDADDTLFALETTKKLLVEKYGRLPSYLRVRLNEYITTEKSYLN